MDRINQHMPTFDELNKPILEIATKEGNLPCVCCMAETTLRAHTGEVCCGYCMNTGRYFARLVILGLEPEPSVPFRCANKPLWQHPNASYSGFWKADRDRYGQLIWT